jgi:molybdopterin converting factor small subunit
MKIRLELFATLGPYLPARSSDDAPVLEVPTSSTVADIASRLGIPADMPWIALVNGQEPASGQHLVEGDVVSMFPPLAGGQAQNPEPAARALAIR